MANRDRARVSTVPPSSARDFYLLGTSLLARGRPDLAELPLSRAVALDARRFWAWFTLGICHSDQGRHADAAFDFSVSTTLAPDFAWPHLNRGLALARSGRLREARVAYDRALELNPDFTEALVDRALACLELGDWIWDQATRDLDRAIALGRRTPSILAARADALAHLGRRDEAEQAFAEAIQAADPNDPIPLVAAGTPALRLIEPAPRPTSPAPCTLIRTTPAPISVGLTSCGAMIPTRPWSKSKRPSTPSPTSAMPSNCAPCSAPGWATPLPRPMSTASSKYPHPGTSTTPPALWRFCRVRPPNPGSSHSPSISSDVPSIPECPRHASLTIRTSTPCGSLRVISFV